MKKGIAMGVMAGALLVPAGAQADTPRDGMRYCGTASYLGQVGAPESSMSCAVARSVMHPSAFPSGKVSCSFTLLTQGVGVYIWKAGPVRCPKARAVMHRWVKYRRETRGWDCWPGRHYYICDRRGPGRAYAVVDPLPGMGD